jgi:glycosyltransferase involved in cell wall biosynthesis
LIKGKILPAELPVITAGATIGISLFEKVSLSNFYSLSNRFFDYLQAGVPQLCSDYPAYREINDFFQVALLIVDHTSLNIAHQLNNLLENEVLRSSMREKSLQAAKILNWENEEIGLVSFYSKIWK